jgi:hypothetical protein
MFLGAIILLVGCGTAASQAPSAPAANAPSAASGAGVAASQPGTGASNAAAASPDNGPIGGDIGNRTKGSVRAQVTGDLTSSIDLPFGAPAAVFEINGPGTAYLPFTDEAAGTLFLTIDHSQLVLAYAGPNNVGITNGSTPCTLTVATLDASQAKGTFTCKNMMLLRADGMGTADISGSFEGHR